MGRYFFAFPFAQNIFWGKYVLAKCCRKSTKEEVTSPPPVLPHPREDGPPPPPGGRLPSDSPPPPPGNRTTTIHAHFQIQKLHCKTKEYSGRIALPSRS